MIYKLGTKTKINLYSILKAKNPLSEKLISAVEEFIKVTPIDFGIIGNGGYRSEKMQYDLFLVGNSKCDGFKHKSFHQLGLAVDLVPWVDGKYTWSEKHTFYLAGAFMAFCKDKGYNITSGADWNGDGNLKDGWDSCHMQIGE